MGLKVHEILHELHTLLSKMKINFLNVARKKCRVLHEIIHTLRYLLKLRLKVLVVPLLNVQ